MGTKLLTKTDTSENWKKAINFTPKEGELIFYSDIEQCKIGDGKTLVNDLDFIGQKIVSEYDIENAILTLKWG